MLQHSAVVINDSKVAETSEGFLPVVADISDFTREGEKDFWLNRRRYKTYDACWHQRYLRPHLDAATGDRAGQ